MSKAALQYLERCVAQDKDTWFSIHHRVLNSDKREEDSYPGSAHQTLRTALRDAMYWTHKGYDVYLAMGAYLNAGEHYPNKPFPSALRQKMNLTACKNLYMDVDVKKGAYGSTKEAKQAVLKFIGDVRLPLPTIIVASGSGGLHVYWTLDELITPQEFDKLAGKLVTVAMQHGIHFDNQCTTDRVRLLRVADTWNFKTNEPKPVTLIWDSKIDVSADVMRAALEPYPVWVTPKGDRPREPHVPDDNDDMALPRDSFPPIDIDEAAKDCAFLRSTLHDGGAHLPEPLWKHSISLACHTSNPEENAHRLSRGHESYTVEGTDIKLAQAQMAREQRGIGPPLCSTLMRDGVQQCPQCPYNALGTTPLHVQFKKPGAKAPQFVKKPGNRIDTDLPRGYYRGNDKLIYTTHTSPDGEDEVCAFEYPIIFNSGYIEAGATHKITFSTMQAGQVVQKTFDTTAVSDQYLLNRAMSAQSLPITGGLKQAKDFMANYLKLLQDSGRTFITAPAFGWSLDADGDMGFAFAGEFVSKGGTFKCARAGEGGELYGVVGEQKPWRDLADIVLTKDRPDLCMIAATSFGAPLIRMSGQDGLILGIWSGKSGIGKTTALKLNQAVWSMPTLGGLTDTVNYTFAKCALIRHIPVNYDEIKGAKQIENMVDVCFQLTGGGERGRADRSGNVKVKREFQTNVNYAANGSIIAPVRDSQLGTDASWLRMFEMRGIEEYDLAYDVSTVGRMTQDLKLNYGHAGRKYAQFIGKNHEQVLKSYVALHDSIVAALKPFQEERFWMSAISTTLMGAKLANHLGLANFPIPEMYAFAVKEYRFLQKELTNSSTDYGRDSALVSAIGAFLNDKRERNLVILDKTWTTKGRPTKAFAKVVNDHQGKQWARIDVQLSGEPVTLRVSDAALGEWCGRTKRPKSAILHALQDKLGARLTGTTLGSGSNKAGSRENCWLIDPMGTILEPAVDEYVTQYGLKP